jgi:hypothetical protein
LSVTIGRIVKVRGRHAARHNWYVSWTSLSLRDRGSTLN